LLPNLKVEESVRSFSVKTNDYMFVIYVSSLIRSVISLHNLINNKITTKEIEIENAKKDKEREEEIRKRKEDESKRKVEEALKKSGEAGTDAPPEDSEAKK
jgi:26S proteasome regulatory subunit N8